MNSIKHLKRVAYGLFAVFAVLGLLALWGSYIGEKEFAYDLLLISEKDAHRVLVDRAQEQMRGFPETASLGFITPEMITCELARYRSIVSEYNMLDRLYLKYGRKITKITGARLVGESIAILTIASLVLLYLAEAWHRSKEMDL